MAEERYQLKRQQSQIEFQRIKSIERQSRRNSDPTSIEAQPSYTDGASLNTFSDHKAGGHEKLKGLSLLRSRIIGLLTKKVIYTLRKWPLFLLIVRTLYLIFNQHNFLGNSKNVSFITILNFVSGTDSNVNGNLKSTNNQL